MSQKKKVLVDIYYLLVAQTGVRTYTEQLVRQITSGRSMTHEYIVVPDYRATASKGYFRGRTSLFRNLLFHLTYFVWKQIRLPLLAARHKADVILCPDYLTPAWKTKAIKIPVIHDAFFWEDEDNYNKWWLKYFRRAILLGLRGRSVVLTISQFAKQSLAPILPKDQPFEIAFQGSRFEKEEELEEAAYQKYGLQKGRYFLFLGVLEKRKNLATLVKAFVLFLALNKDTDIKLVLAGQRGTRQRLDDYPAIVQLVEELQLNEKVVLTGYLKKEEVSSLYAGALSFVFPSANEGFGLPVLEAFSQHVPVIVSSQGALCEIGGEAVLSFDTFNPQALCECLLKVSESDILRKKMVEKGTERLRLYSWDKFFVSLEEIISRRA
jgi:glycosyltransferase involved in cell wall biosynthesis